MNCCCETREYTVGEILPIEWNLKSCRKNNLFVITSARYEIRRRGQVIKTGNMQIDGSTVSMMFEAIEKGSFTVKAFVSAPPYVIAGELEIDVTG